MLGFIAKRAAITLGNYILTSLNIRGVRNVNIKVQKPETSIIIIIIIIIIISILKEDNVFSIIASLPYGPPMNTDIDYYRT